MRFAHSLHVRRSTSTLVRMDFTSLPLHDATLESVVMHWPSATCRIAVIPVGFVAEHEITFLDVTELGVPRQLPWGRSSSINRVQAPEPGCFDIEMQSGDVVRVRASSFSYGVKL